MSSELLVQKLYARIAELEADNARLRAALPSLEALERKNEELWNDAHEVLLRNRDLVREVYDLKHEYALEKQKLCRHHWHELYSLRKQIDGLETQIRNLKVPNNE